MAPAAITRSSSSAIGERCRSPATIWRKPRRATAQSQRRPLRQRRKRLSNAVAPRFQNWPNERAAPCKARQRRSSASAAFRARRALRLPALLWRQRSVMVEIGSVEMLKCDALRVAKRHAAIVVRVRAVEQARDRCAAHIRVARLDLAAGDRGIEFHAGENAVLVGVGAYEKRGGDGTPARLDGHLPLRIT